MTVNAERNIALELVLEAGKCASGEEWLFHLVNRSVGLVRYDRASVWTLGARPRLLAVSGVEAADGRGAFASRWSRALSRLRQRRSRGVLSPEAFVSNDVWSDVTEKTPDLNALWLPMPETETGALFERWDSAFSPEEIAELERLVEAYALAYPGKGRRGGRKWGRLVFWPVFLACVAAALVFVRVPLRIVAPCEVSAKNPRLVSAPMDGVIESVFVTPGQRVKVGDELAAYDSRLMEEELKISRRQVEVVEADLAGARARGFSEQRYRGEVTRLEARLEQEMARLQALETRYARRLVVSQVDGVVQLDDARAWRGRPVSTGQAILWVVNPEETRVKLWLPQDDRIDFDMERAVRVYLYSSGGEGRDARLTYVSSFAQPSIEGGYGFPAEAEWAGGEGTVPLGLRGSAFLYGDDCSLGYWLLRRPMAWLRRRAGI